MLLFWVVMPCGLVGRYQCFRKTLVSTYWVHTASQSRRTSSSSSPWEPNLTTTIVLLSAWLITRFVTLLKLFSINQSDNIRWWNKRYKKWNPRKWIPAEFCPTGFLHGFKTKLTTKRYEASAPGTWLLCRSLCHFLLSYFWSWKLQL
jgi:hypothetical protein